MTFTRPPEQQPAKTRRLLGAQLKRATSSSPSGMQRLPGGGTAPGTFGFAGGGAGSGVLYDVPMSHAMAVLYSAPHGRNVGDCEKWRDSRGALGERRQSSPALWSAKWAAAGALARVAPACLSDVASVPCVSVSPERPIPGQGRRRCLSAHARPRNDGVTPHTLAQRYGLSPVVHPENWRGS